MATALAEPAQAPSAVRPTLGTDPTLAERLASLNEAQRRAVDCVEGPLLCLAGAGSGKTRVLTTRIANLIQGHGVEPRSILALTFTRKAAEEMRTRLAGIVGEERAGAITLGTFHAVGVGILREYGSLIGLTGRFSIADDSELVSRARAVLRRHGVDRGDPDYRPRDVVERFAEAKTYLTAALHRREADFDLSRVDVLRGGSETILERAVADGALDEWDLPLFVKLYADFQGQLLADDTLDFQDLLSLPCLLFRDRPEVLRIYQDRWTHISVDEYQDTDDIQEMILGALANAHRNLMVVGDDDQAIYGFRNARVDNIRTFESRYAPCTVVQLEENYRSSPNILAVANAVISEQEDRPYGKQLRPNLPDGPPVRVWSCASQEAEARAVVTECRALLDRGEIGSLDDVMVLYRVNSIADPLERALRRERLPYRLVGGTRFHDRREVRDLMGYLRLASNWSDSLSFERVVNVPSRGIGPATMEKVLQEARVRGLDPVHICLEADTYASIRGQQKKALVEFGSLIQRIGEADRQGGVTRALRVVLEQTGYRHEIVDALADAEQADDVEGQSDARVMLRAVDDFVGYVEEFSRTTEALQGSPARSVDLAQSLATSTLVDDPAGSPEDLGDAAHGALNLLSIHASKGLEAPVVFVIGLEDGVLPITPRPGEIDEGVDVEEEGRLFYVAVTRAQNRLILSSARTRELRGDSPRYLPRSRFLARLPESGHLIEDRSA